MRAFLCAVLLGLFFTATSLHAEDAAGAKDVIEKAVKAAGGADKVSKPCALVWKYKGTFSGLGDPIELTGEVIQQSAKGQYKNVVNFEFMGNKGTRIVVFDGTKGWASFMGMTMEMGEDELGETKEQIYASRLADLSGIQDPALKFESLGESKVGDKAVVGFKVTSPGHKEVKLYFDKASGLVVKAQRTAKNTMTNEDVDQDQIYEDYKEWPDGVKRAMKQTSKRMGKDFIATEVTESKVEPKVDDKIFSKPAE